MLLGPRTGSGGFSVRLSQMPPSPLLSSIGSMMLRGTNSLVPGVSTTVQEAQIRYSSWGTPELVAKRSGIMPPQTRPAEEVSGSTAEARFTIQELVKNQLDARRQIYESRAFRAYKDRKYHEACDQLVLADTTVQDDPERRIRLKLFFVFAAIAAEQYQEASNALNWILKRDVRTGADFIPGVLNQCRDVASLCAQPQEFSDQVIQMELFIANPQVQNKPIALSLRAIMAWGGNDPANAKFYAHLLIEELEKFLDANRDLADDPEVMSWRRLYDYMQLADPTGQPVVVKSPTSQPESAPSGQMEQGSGDARPSSLTLRAVPISTQ